MKHIIAIISLALMGLFASNSIAFGNFNSSPYNFENSRYNFENSRYNFKNSPMNFKNSRMNSNSRNRIYNESGNDIGYGVQKSNGGMNFFSNDGQRLGFKPGW